MSKPRDWHYCEVYAGDAGACDIVLRDDGWAIEDGEYSYGAVFQHGARLTIVYCPFCGVKLPLPPKEDA